MAKTTDKPKTTNTDTTHPLIGFLTRFRMPLIITGVGILAAVVGLLVVLSIQNNRSEQALVAVESLQDQFADWNAGTDEERESGFEALEAAANEIVDQYGSGYAVVRATMVIADANAELERWAQAASEYETAVEAGGESYLVGVALMDAAIAAENAGDADRALANYQRLVGEFGDTSPEAPRAAFSVARILETTDRIAEAADAYRAVVEDYPASSWTNLARNRIISLTVEGRIGG